MRFQAFHAVRRQGCIDHFRAQVGTADADIDDVGNPFAGKARPGSGAYLFGENPHFCQHFIDFRHHILAAKQHRAIAAIS